MRLRPWHLILSILGVSTLCIILAYIAGGDAKDILLGLGVNLLSSVVFFVMLEVYWQQWKRANGKEVGGLDYLRFARNITRSSHVRVLATFIYPLSEHPNHAEARKALIDALCEALARPTFGGVQLLFLDPRSAAARTRAAERKDDDVLRRMAETIATLRMLQKRFDSVTTPARFEVRLFSRTPPFALFQTDNFGSISFYYRDRPISEVTRYEFFMDSPIGEFVEKTFDDLWRDEKTTTLEEYIRAHPEPAASAT
jgi:hypothetical protein